MTEPLAPSLRVVEPEGSGVGMLCAHEKFLRTVKDMMEAIDGKLADLDALRAETESLVTMLIRVHGGCRAPVVGADGLAPPRRLEFDDDAS